VTSQSDMVNRMILTLTVVVAGLLVANASAQENRNGDDRAEAHKHGWNFNYDEAKVQATKSNRPLMVVFRCVP